MARALERRAAKGVSAFRAFVEAYLDDAHLASLDSGCPVAALACDMPRQSAPVREASAQRVKRLVAGLRSALPHASRATASVVAGTLVVNLPGSPRGAVESLEAIAGIVPHAVSQIRGVDH